MQENVVVEFSVDTSKASPAIDMLEKMGAITAEQAKAARKMGEEYKAQQEAIANGVRASVGEVEKFADTYKKLAGNIATGAIKNTFNDIAATLQKLNPEFANLSKGQQMVAVAEQMLKQQSDELNDAFNDSYRAVQELQSAIEGIEQDNKELEDEMKAGKMTQEEYSDAIHSNNMELELLGQRLADATNSMKAAAGSITTSSGSYKQMQSTLASLKEGYANLTAAEREATGKDILQEIKVLEDALKQMDKELKGDAVPTARTRLRELREEMIRMEDAGEVNTEAFRKLAEEAGALSDQLGDTQETISYLASDSKLLDSIMSAGEGLAGGFETVTAAGALLGGDMEALQEAFYKVQAAMATLNGVQAVANALNKNSSLMEGIRLMQARMMTPAINAQTGATVKLTVVQRIFNAVAKANPYVLLATGVLALVGAIVWLIASEDKSTKAQIRNNEATKLRLEQQKQLIEGIKEESAEREHALSHEIDMMKIQDAAAGEVAKKERELAEERVKNAETIQKTLEKENGDLEKNRQKVEELEKALYKLDMAKIEGKSKVAITINGEVKKVKVDDEKVRESIQGALDNFTAKVDVQVEADDAAQKEREEQAKLLAKQKQDAIELAKEAAREELALRRQARDSTLKLIEDEKKRRILESSENFARQKNDLKRQGDELAKAGKLTAEAKRALNATLKNLEEQQRNDLDAIAVEFARKEIAERRELEDLEIAGMDEGFEKRRKLTETEYNRQIKDLKVRLETEKGLTEEQQERINKSIELLVRKREKEIGEIVKEERIKAAEDAAQAEIDILDDMYDQERVELAKMYAQGLVGEEDYNRRKEEIQRKYADDSFNVEVNSINEKLKHVEAGSDEEAELLKNLSDARKRLAKENADYEVAQHEESAAKRLEKEQALQAALKELQSAAFDMANELSQMFFDNEKARLEQQLADLDKFYTTDAEAAAKNRNLKLVSEEELARKEAEIKNKQAAAEKQASYIEAVINAAKAITAAFTVPPPASFILAGITAAMTAIQIAKIASSPVPRYAKGRKGGRGEYALTGEFGPEIMWIPEGASVIPAHKSKKLMEGMRIAGEYRTAFPKVPSFSNIDVAGLKEAQYVYNIGIDYDKFGRAVARNMPTSPDVKQLNVNIDEKGFTKFLSDKAGRTVLLNTRG